MAANLKTVEKGDIRIPKIIKTPVLPKTPGQVIIQYVPGKNDLKINITEVVAIIQKIAKDFAGNDVHRVDMKDPKLVYYVNDAGRDALLA